MYIYIVHYLKFFLSCSIKNLTLASFSRLFTIKSDQFLFLQVLISTVVFSQSKQLLKISFTIS